MGRKHFTVEQIIGLLREADVKLSHSRNVGTIFRKMAIISLLNVFVTPTNNSCCVPLITRYRQLRSTKRISCIIRCVIATSSDWHATSWSLLRKFPFRKIPRCPLCQRGRKEMTDFSFLSLRGGLLHDVAVSEIAAHTACARNDSNSGFPITSGMTCGGSKWQESEL